MKINEKEKYFLIEFQLKNAYNKTCVETITISNYLRNYT